MNSDKLEFFSTAFDGFVCDRAFGLAADRVVSQLAKIRQLLVLKLNAEDAGAEEGLLRASQRLIDDEVSFASLWISGGDKLKIAFLLKEYDSVITQPQPPNVADHTFSALLSEVLEAWSDQNPGTKASSGNWLQSREPNRPQ